MKKSIIIFIISILLTSCASRQVNISEKYSAPKGVWELVRYDNIPKSERPPSDLVNVTYFFYEDGRYRFFIPGKENNFTYGRGNTPYKKFIPLQIKENYIKTWFGLTNDLYGVKKYKFLTDTEIQIQFRDGSLAIIKKTLDRPSDYKDKLPVCVPHTIRGVSYSPDYISKILKDMRTVTHESKYKHAIVGAWQRGDLEETGKKLTLIFSENGKYEVISSRKSSFSSEINEYKGEGTYELYNDIIKINIRSCFPPHRFTIANGILTMISSKEVFKLQRVSKQL
jgi:hypothetical protein